MDSAMDLSLRNSGGVGTPQNCAMFLSPTSAVSGSVSSASATLSKLSDTAIATAPQGVQIVRPIPRPPWSILWYQNLWNLTEQHQPSPNSNGAGTHTNCGTGGSGSVSLLSKSKGSLRSTSSERSSFSVLNSLSTNTVNTNYGLFYGTTVPQHPEHQQQHYSYGEAIGAPASFGASSSLLKPRTEQPYHQRSSVFGNREDTLSTSRNEYLSDTDDTDNDNDSDNSENIVVTTTTTPSYPTTDSAAKSSPQSLGSPGKSSVSGSYHHANKVNSTVILDVACCDGPVQFKRVSNPNFALTVEHNNVEASPVPVPETSVVSKLDTTTAHQNIEPVPEMETCTSVANNMESIVQRHQIQNCLPMQNANLQSSSATSPSAACSSSSVATHKSYLCIYCNQSFKSLFCYQKHKKRHLNPVSVDITTTNSTSYQRGSSLTNKKCVGVTTSIAASSGSGGLSSGFGGGRGDGSGTGGRASSSNSKTGVGGGGGGGHGIIGMLPENAKAKTKDLNVQFFPCKKCGCKFPSYYFVHKHRKSCH